jgi:hypothetical protein
MLLEVLLTHLKPQRKDELSKVVSAFIEEAFPAGRPQVSEPDPIRGQ